MTAGLIKATLGELGETGQPVGQPLDVQFNPTSLKLTLTNQVEGGQSRGRQARQYIGSSSTELAFELIFDTADEARNAAGEPRSVRERTALVEKFLVPKKAAKGKQVPPRVRFQWGTFTIDGLITSLAIDMDLFAADGTALRAKMNVTIKEQNARFQDLVLGAGANDAGMERSPTAPPNGAPGAVAGSAGRPASADRTAVALGGESVADFAARQGLDPGAWRAIAARLPGDPSSLPAGLAVDFSSSATAAPGLGATRGVEPSASAPLAAALGLGPARTAVDPTAAGIALSNAGGLAAALQSTRSAEARAAAGDARAAFGRAPAPSRATAPADGVPAAADARETGYGHGVPLRPRVHGAAEQRAAELRGGVRLRGAPREHDAQTVSDPTAPPWTRMPERTAPASARPARRGRCACGCGGHGSGKPAGCGCSGGGSR